MLILELNTIGTRTTGTTVVTTISYSGSSVTSLCRYWRKTCNNEKNLTKWEKKRNSINFHNRQAQRHKEQTGLASRLGVT